MAAAPPNYVLRMWLFFAGYFLVGGVTLPFFPVWLESRGLSDVEIAQVIALPVLVRVFLTPLAGIYADRAPNRRFAVITFTLPAVLVFALAYGADGFLPILITTGLALVLWGLALPPAEALALTGVRRYGLDYGRMRLGGSVSFIVANLGSGAILSLLHPEAIFFLMLATLVSSVAVAFILPVTPKEVRALDDATRPDFRPSREVLGNRAFIVLMIGGALLQASHAMLYSFGSLSWQAHGYSGVQIGAFWAFGIAAEITLFATSTRLVARYGAYAFLVASGVGAMIRWLLFPFAIEAGFLAVAAIMTLHAITYGLSYLGIQHALARLVPDRMTASAQGIFAMAMGLLMAGTTSLSGPIYATWGIGGFFAMVPVAAAGLICVVAVRRYVRG